MKKVASCFIQEVTFSTNLIHFPRPEAPFP